MFYRTVIFCQIKERFKVIFRTVDLWRGNLNLEQALPLTIKVILIVYIGK